MAIQTRWTVLTGVPASGKTTVLEALRRDHGAVVVEEDASRVIKQDLAKGLSLEDVFAAPDLADRIAAEQIRTEEGLDPATRLVKDRGPLDEAAYFRKLGRDPKHIVAASSRYRYADVFLFDPLPLQSNGIRAETDAERRVLDPLYEQAYRQLGYSVIRVPVGTVEERVQFILDRTPPLNGSEQK